MPTLQRTFALEQMDDVPLPSPAICTSIWRARSTSFSTIKPALPNALLASRIAEPISIEIVMGRDRAHPLAAAAGGRLEHHREADLPRRRGDLFRFLARRLATRHGRDACGVCFVLGGGLVTKPLDRLRCGADEDQSRSLDGARKHRILGEKAKPRMDRLRPGRLRGRDDGVDAQIAFGGGGSPISVNSPIVLTCSELASARE